MTDYDWPLDDDALEDPDVDDVALEAVLIEWDDLDDDLDDD